MSSRYEFVYARHPDLEGIGRMSRAALARKPGFYECDAEGNPVEPYANGGALPKPTERRQSEPTPDADLEAGEDKPTAEPAGKSKTE